jgi:hypothetical protein
MKKVIKTDCVIMAVFMITIMVCLVNVRDAWAPGGKETPKGDYQVTVRNDTKSRCIVWLNCSERLRYKSGSIGPGQTHTFYTTNSCPEHLKGWAYVKLEGQDVSLFFSSYCTGKEHESYIVECCENSSWRMVLDGSGYRFRKD